MKRTDRRRLPLVAGLAATLAVSAFGVLGAPPRVIAASDAVRLDLGPEDGTAAPAGTATLSVAVVDDEGTPLTPGRTVRIYFLDGSANHPGGNGNRPDLTCGTGVDGTCSVSYPATNEGIDLLCAVVSGSPNGCDEETRATPSSTTTSMSSG